MSVQYVDPTVSRAKFDREIAEYKALGEEYRRLGWFLVHAEYPRVLVVLAAAKLTPSPIIMGVAFDYTNYDAAPPSVRIVNSYTGEPYKHRELPTQLNRSLPQQEIPLPGFDAVPMMKLQSVQPYMQAYGPEEIPFLCIAGVREYHDHPAHSGDIWELHRQEGAGRLVRLLEIVHRYGIAPIAGFGVQLVPQVGINYGPPPP